jgi:hypothetical protein
MTESHNLSLLLNLLQYNLCTRLYIVLITYLSLSLEKESGRSKTREELLAEERDYKRRRMSYRGKKMKRNPTEVHFEFQISKQFHLSSSCYRYQIFE